MSSSSLELKESKAPLALEVPERIRTFNTICALAEARNLKGLKSYLKDHCVDIRQEFYTTPASFLATCESKTNGYESALFLITHFSASIYPIVFAYALLGDLDSCWNLFDKALLPDEQLLVLGNMAHGLAKGGHLDLQPELSIILQKKAFGINGNSGELHILRHIVLGLVENKNLKKALEIAQAEHLSTHRKVCLKTEILKGLALNNQLDEILELLPPSTSSDYFPHCVKVIIYLAIVGNFCALNQFISILTKSNCPEFNPENLSNALGTGLALSNHIHADFDLEKLLEKIPSARRVFTLVSFIKGMFHGFALAGDFREIQKLLKKQIKEEGTLNETYLPWLLGGFAGNYHFDSIRKPLFLDFSLDGSLTPLSADNQFRLIMSSATALLHTSGGLSLVSQFFNYTKTRREQRELASVIFKELSHRDFFINPPVAVRFFIVLPTIFAELFGGKIVRQFHPPIEPARYAHYESLFKGISYPSSFLSPFDKYQMGMNSLQLFTFLLALQDVSTHMLKVTKRSPEKNAVLVVDLLLTAASFLTENLNASDMLLLANRILLRYSPAKHTSWASFFALSAPEVSPHLPSATFKYKKGK